MNARTQRNGDPRYCDTAHLCAYLDVGQQTARRIAEEANAVVRLGRLVRYDLLRVDQHIDALRRQRKEGSDGK